MVRQSEMGRPGGVSERVQNGSRRPRRAYGIAVFGAFIGLCLTACLHGDAEPIVRLDGGVAVPDSAPPTPVGCDPATAPLALFYRAAQPASTANGVDFIVKVANRTGASLSLRRLALRYYLTVDIAPPLQTQVFYAGTCCGATRAGFNANVAISVNAITATKADHYLEITFDDAAGEVLDGDAVQ